MGHTPGPWKAFRAAKSILITDTEMDNICELEARNEDELSKNKANAFLISAVPDMFKCLKDIKEWLEEGDYDDSFMDPIKQALKKAKGE